MKIFQFTNTRAQDSDPEARSIAACARALLEAGHEVVVIEPTDDYPLQPGRPPRFTPTHLRPEPPPLTVPEVIPPPLPAPDLIHAQHPFLAGEEALRLSGLHAVPLLFTARLRYESPCPLPSSEAAELRAFIDKLTVCFANRCDLVVAPSPALAVRLFEGGVMRPIHVVPDATEPADATRQTAHLLELYTDAVRSRHTRGPVRECPPMERLRRELALAWQKVHPAAPIPAGRPLAAFSSFRDGTALTC